MAKLLDCFNINNVNMDLIIETLQEGEDQEA